MAVADARVLLTEVVPGQTEFLVAARLLHLLQRQRLSGGAFIGDDGEGLLTADPCAHVDRLLR
jgi:hypothetical protein